MLTTFPQCNFSLEFPEILNQSYNAYYGPGESGIYKIMHCGILISMPYEHCDMVILTAVPPSLRPHLPSLKQRLWVLSFVQSLLKNSDIDHNAIWHSLFLTTYCLITYTSNNISLCTCIEMEVVI